MAIFGVKKFKTQEIGQNFGLKTKILFFEIFFERNLLQNGRNDCLGPKWCLESIFVSKIFTWRPNIDIFFSFLNIRNFWHLKIWKLATPSIGGWKWSRDHITSEMAFLGTLHDFSNFNFQDLAEKSRKKSKNRLFFKH